MQAYAKEGEVMLTSAPAAEKSDGLAPLSPALQTLLRRLNRLSGVDIDSRIAALQWPELNEFGFDCFGLHPEFLRRAAPFVSFLYKRYFRVDARGMEKIPSGRCLLVANHSGQVPFDGFMVGAAVLGEGRPPRLVRSMVERVIPNVPFLSVILARSGQVVGTPDNCRRLLQSEQLVLVFPEGSRGISKPWHKRYQLQEFGQGFLRLALESQTPIVPVGVVGAEEQAPSFYNVAWLAKLLGLPSFPITPTFPLLGPLGLLPLPVRYRIRFGDPIRVNGNSGGNRKSIDEIIQHIRDAVADRVRVGLEEREHVFW